MPVEKIIKYFDVCHVTFPELVDLPTLYFFLHYLLPYVGNIGTIGTEGITNGTCIIGETLNDHICLPMGYHFYQLRTHAKAEMVLMCTHNLCFEQK